MTGGKLALVIVAGSLVFAGVLVSAIFGALNRISRRVIARLEAEGIVARTGWAWVTLRARNYRGPRRRASAMVQKGRGELILTKSGLHAVGVRLGQGSGMVDFAPDDLAHCRAWSDAGRVVVATSRPPLGATGELEVSAPATDPAGFLAALRERGVADR